MEIGSEFHNGSSATGKRTFCLDGLFLEKRYVLSGRTGFALIADELIARRNIKSVALPDYCCASMIYPFTEKGLSVLFYPVPKNFEKATDDELEAAVEIIKNADAVLILDYFGFIRSFAKKLTVLSQTFGKVVIVDATQTAFSMADTYKMADYVLISYRKWSDLLCTEVLSIKTMSVPVPSVNSDEYVHTWRKAALLKKQYLDHTVTDKSEYLGLYKRANSALAESFENKTSPEDEVKRLNTVDSDSLICRRRENSSFLINEIKNSEIPGIRLMFDRVGNNDCPLFVPVLVDGNRRNSIRSKMAERNLYCPAHWPIDTDYPYKETDFHNREISLVCDQRYTLKDMELELQILSEASAN